MSEMLAELLLHREEHRAGLLGAQRYRERVAAIWCEAVDAGVVDDFVAAFDDLTAGSTAAGPTSS